PELVEYYPGDNYVDIVGIDAYFENLQEINQLKNAYTTMIKAFNKPYALTETGPRANWNPNGEWRPKQPFDYEYLIQTIAKDMPKTVFFLTWNTGFGPAWNLKAQQTYTHPWVATLGEF
ncbi:MAG: glycosyl hydrolase, partial [Shewanella sp.]